MTTAAERLPARRTSGLLVRALRFVRHHLLTVYAMLAFAYLLLPIAVVIVFSFNNPAGKFNIVWQGFTFDNWLHPFNSPDVQQAVTVSVQIAALSSVIATALGTFIALALVRYRFRGNGATNLLIFLPMATPEIVLGASLLTLFLNNPLGVLPPLGFGTVLIAHIMFCISYVVVTVKARLVGFDRHLEEAAMDLGANEVTTFLRVTLPLIAPAILAGALLSFALSVDDFVITYLNSGSVVTFPLYVWGAARTEISPAINVIGSAIFFIAIAIMLVNVLWQWRRQPKGAV